MTTITIFLLQAAPSSIVLLFFLMVSFVTGVIVLTAILMKLFRFGKDVPAGIAIYKRPFFGLSVLIAIALTTAFLFILMKILQVIFYSFGS